MLFVTGVGRDRRIQRRPIRSIDRFESVKEISKDKEDKAEELLGRITGRIFEHVEHSNQCIGLVEIEILIN